MFKEIKAKEIFAFLAMFLDSISAIFSVQSMWNFLFYFLTEPKSYDNETLPQGFSVAVPFFVDMLYYWCHIA